MNYLIGAGRSKMKKRSPPLVTPTTSKRCFRLVIVFAIAVVIFQNTWVKYAKDTAVHSLVKGSADIGGAPVSSPDYSAFTQSEEVCQALTKDPRWNGIARQVWERNGRSKEDLPRTLDDPVVMTKTVGGKPLSKPFAMCTLAKNGCSHWRRLLRRVRGLKDYLGYPHGRKTNGLQYPSTTSKAELASTFRWAIVRDPHERLLSAWSEKCNTTTRVRIQNCNWLVCKNKRKFKPFVKCLWRLYSRNAKNDGKRALCGIDEHFRPQSCSCSFRKMRYDALLPVESMDAWYPPLIKCLQIESATQDFWSKGLPFYTEKPTKRGSTTTHAASKVTLMYNKETYDYVAKMYSDDLVFSRKGSALEALQDG